MRYTIKDNKIIDTKLNCGIGTIFDDQLNNAKQLIERANRGEQEFKDDAAWIEEQKAIFDK